ncbi:MAG: hypothetical protein RIT26_1460 [Pseudomonadota bacterium]
MKPSLLCAQILGFQWVWLAWAWGVPRGMLWPGTLSSVLFLAAHRLWLSDRRSDLKAALICVWAGLLHDSVLMHWGWLGFEALNPSPLAAIQPWWMALLWACLGCTLHQSLGWLKGRIWLAAPVCSVAGVMSYQVADQLGALTLGPPWPTWLALGLFWGLFIPLAQSFPGGPASGPQGRMESGGAPP